MKRVFLFILLSIASNCIFSARDFNERPSWAKNTPNPPAGSNYFFAWGVGEGATENQATNAAWADALQKSLHELGVVGITSQDVKSVAKEGIDAVVAFNKVKRRFVCATDLIPKTGGKKIYILIQVQRSVNGKDDWNSAETYNQCEDSEFEKELDKYKKEFEKDNKTPQSINIEYLKKSGEYYWNESIEKTQKKAEDKSLTALTKSIVNSLFPNLGQDSETAEAIIESYRLATARLLSDLENHPETKLLGGMLPVVQDGGGYHIVRYLKKTEARKVFAERETLIKDYAALAAKNEKELKIADALKYNYWALQLMKSHPDGKTLTAEIDGKEQKLPVFLPHEIDRILSGISFKVTNKETQPNLTTYYLEFTYKGQKVINLEYKYHTGQHISPVQEAKNGIGLAELSGSPDLHKDLDVYVEYEFSDGWQIDKEMENLFKVLEPNTTFSKKASVTAKIEKPAELTPKPAAVVQPAGAAASPSAKTLMSIDGSRYLHLLQKVQEAIATKNYEQARDCFTPEGYDIYQKLVNNGNAKIVGAPTYKFIKFDDGIFARSLPVRFTFRNSRQFIENVVFDIEEKSGKIRSLQFAVTENVFSDITSHIRNENDRWKEYACMAIINFIENYQTAYALKRLDYLDQIFSENALIIVGRMVKTATNVEQRTNSLSKERVELIQYSKEQYIKNMRNNFNKQEYINLRFADTDISKVEDTEMYCIQMFQEYFSATYGDKGYLFLQVDLMKPGEPVIYVRTWQERKDPTLAGGKYGCNNF